MYQLDIQNIAGIRSGGAELCSGLNVVRARNWQGKSSFMKSLQVVMGTSGWSGDTHPLTDGATEGEVRLQTEEDTYVTELRRSGTTVNRHGDIYLEDEQNRTSARLFAFLGENNPIREAVRSGGDLAALLTKPLDIENIDEQLAQLKRERRSVETELERAENAKGRLTTVQRTVAQLESDIEELQTQRETLDSGESAEESQKYEQLSSKRAEKDRLQNQIETLENKIERRENRLQQREDKLAELTVPDAPELTTDIEQKRDRITKLESDIDLLEELYRVNKRVLDEGKTRLVTDVEATLSGDNIDCWLCGETTSEQTITERLEAMDEQLSKLQREKATLQTEIDEIQDRRDEVRKQQRRKDDLETEISELNATLEESRMRLADLETQLTDVTDDLESLRENVETTNSQLTEIESEIKYKQNELDEKREELSELEAEASRREHLRERSDELTAEIESLRLRRKEKQRELAERFEETMAEIIEALEPGFESARLAPKTDSEGRITDFDLVVAREGRQTSLDALSEGEVELLGIVTALAGYETFDVGECVPIILLDGLTALSKENYHAVVEYLRSKTDCLVTTAYPELDEFDGNIVSPRDWDVVSNQQSSMS